MTFKNITTKMINYKFLCYMLYKNSVFLVMNNLKVNPVIYSSRSLSGKIPEGLFLLIP